MAYQPLLRRLVVFLIALLYLFVIAPASHHLIVQSSAPLAADEARERTGLSTVALGGGVFQNEILLAGLDHALGDPFAAIDASEDVHQDRLHVVIGENQLERLLDAFLGRAAAHIEYSSANPTIIRGSSPPVKTPAGVATTSRIRV